MLANPLAIGRRTLQQQILGGHQHSRRTVAALQRVAVAERGLEIGDLAGIGEAFDRFNNGPARLNGQRQASTNDISVQANRAGTTNAVLASDMCPRQMQMLPQKVCKTKSRRHECLDLFAINSQ